MPKQCRNNQGKFLPKSHENRKVRSVRLTDSAYFSLKELALEDDLTIADFLEKIANFGVQEMSSQKQGGRGGKRDRSGRPSSWSTGIRQKDTKVIRVPKYIASQVLKYAHDLDKGEDFLSKIESFVSKIESLEQENKLLKKQIKILTNHKERPKEKLCQEIRQLPLF